MADLVSFSHVALDGTQIQLYRKAMGFWPTRLTMNTDDCGKVLLELVVFTALSKDGRAVRKLNEIVPSSETRFEDIHRETSITVLVVALSAPTKYSASDSPRNVSRSP